MNTAALLQEIRRHLSDDLRKPAYRGSEHPMRGHCYVASEALYHLLGGAQSDYVPVVLRIGSETHWYLKHKHTGSVLDPTADQFNFKPDYQAGKGTGFLTKQPSKRTQQLMERIKAGMAQR